MVSLKCDDKSIHVIMCVKVVEGFKAMTISNKTVLNKIMEELQAAKRSIDEPAVMVDHISKIKLLSELILEDHVAGNQTEVAQKITPEKSVAETQKEHKVLQNNQGEDSMSIFDF